MANELHDPTMLTWSGTADAPVFHVNPSVTSVWMSVETMASFFVVSARSLFTPLAACFKQYACCKDTHIRTIGYIDYTGPAEQARTQSQYSFTIVALVAQQLPHVAIARAFSLWLIATQQRYIKWGMLMDTTRVQASQTRLAYAKRQSARL